MKYGIHLPHAGEQATPALIRRHAERAEDLGLADVWVSEHIIVPRDKFPRSPLFFDPVLSLTWAAAVTKRVRLGTTVRGPGRAVRRTRPAAGRGDRDDARGLVGGPSDVQEPLYPVRCRGDDDDTDAGQPDSALVWRKRRARVEAGDPDRERMARQRAHGGPGGADRETAARGAAGGGFHDFHEGAVGWNRSRRAAGAGLSTSTLSDGAAITEFDVLPGSASRLL
jgi:hypothetical protein